MKKQLLALTLGLALCGQTYASELSEQEKNNELIGFGSGIVIGAAIAGPVGAVVAGIFGVMIADDVNDENKLEGAQVTLAKQRNQLTALSQQYAQLKQQRDNQLVAMDKEIAKVLQETQANIQFRTASYEIESHFKPQLDLLAETLKKNPELVVNLSGFADRRGDDSYNQALSEQRVLSVKSYLASKGVISKQVLTTSYGESNPIAEKQTFEDDFFDRRVLVKVSESEESMTASN